MRHVRITCLFSATIVAGLMVVQLYALNVRLPATASNPNSKKATPQWGGLPPGSYTQSCPTTKIVKGTRLSGYCRGKDGLDHATHLDDFQFCDGDIWNNDGQLGCNKNDKSFRFKSAAKAFNNMSFLMLGRAPKGKGIEQGSEVRDWVRLMYSKYGMRNEYEAGLSDQAARKLLELYLSEGENSDLRIELTERAYREALGRAPTDQEKYYTWGAAIVIKQANFQKIFNTVASDPKLREEMLDLAYQTGMGRMAKQGDLNYWKPRNESYRKILDANRAWLYSEKGEKDLWEAARTATWWWMMFEQINNPQAKGISLDDPGIATLINEKTKQALPGYKAKKMIFIEMVGGDSSMTYKEFAEKKGLKGTWLEGPFGRR